MYFWWGFHQYIRAQQFRWCAPLGSEYIYKLMEYLLKAKSCFLCSCMLSVFLNLPELWACAQTRVCSVTPFTDTLSLSLPRLSLKLSAVPCASLRSQRSLWESFSCIPLWSGSTLIRRWAAWEKTPKWPCSVSRSFLFFTVSFNCHSWMFAVEEVNRYKPAVLGLLHRIVCRTEF